MARLNITTRSDVNWIAVFDWLVHGGVALTGPVLASVDLGRIFFTTGCYPVRFGMANSVHDRIVSGLKLARIRLHLERYWP